MSFIACVSHVCFACSIHSFVWFMWHVHSFVVSESSGERRSDCPESILFYKNCTEVESIVMLRRDCSEAMLF